MTSKIEQKVMEIIRKIESKPDKRKREILMYKLDELKNKYDKLMQMSDDGLCIYNANLTNEKDWFYRPITQEVRELLLKRKLSENQYKILELTKNYIEKIIYWAAESTKIEIMKEIEKIVIEREISKKDVNEFRDVLNIATAYLLCFQHIG